MRICLPPRERFGGWSLPLPRRCLPKIAGGLAPGSRLGCLLCRGCLVQRNSRSLHRSRSRCGRSIRLCAARPHRSIAANACASGWRCSPRLLPLLGLVCLLPPSDRVHLRQSGIPALQRHANAHAAAHPAGFGASHSAAHRAHEHVCARALHVGRHAVAAIAGTGWQRAAADLPREPSYSLCRPRGQCALFFRGSGALC